MSQLRGHRTADRILSKANSNDTIGNQTRDRPACSAVFTAITVCILD